MTEKKSTARTFGEMLKNEVKNNEKFYFFSPDETTSNRLDAIYDETTRAWSNLNIEPQDLPEGDGGHIIELLSENTLFSVMIGHIMAGEPAMMASYESFFTIVVSQILQQLKFFEQSETVSFRPDYPAVNLLSTSTCWRQDHNGFSHQSPMLVSALLERPGNKVNCLFPVDSESAKATFDFMMNSENVVNLTTFNKTEEPQYINPEHAKYQFENGASVFNLNNKRGEFVDPGKEGLGEADIVFATAGDIATREAIEAIKSLKEDFPKANFRLINILALSHDKIGTTENQMDKNTFDKMFGKVAPIITNFHGYADALKNIIGNYTDETRVIAHGFEEHGSTTTPFDMLALNHASRYDLALDVAKEMHRPDLVEKYEDLIAQNSGHAREFGEDLVEL